MRAVQFKGYGAIGDVVEVTEVPSPARFRTGEVRLKVHAAALNPIDYKMVRGELRRIEKVRFPSPLGFDASGTVTAVGKGTFGVKAGDEVFVRTSRDRIGTFAQEAVVLAEHVAPMPRGWSHAEAASIPLVGLTSVQALEERARARAGQSVLIHAGSGGLGTFAVQHAKVLGLHVTTTVSGRNEALVRSLGADAVICYDRESYLERPERYDIVFDTLGGAYTLDAFRVVKQGGVVVSVAGPPDRDFADDVRAGWLTRVAIGLMNRKVYRNAASAGASYYRFMTKSNGSTLARIGRWMEEGRIRPVIDRRYRLEEAVEALEYLQTGRARGKVVLEVGA